MADSWYYVERGERKGPIYHEEMEQKIKSRLLGESDYVWKKGFENWKKIKEVEELSQILAASIPSIPPIPAPVFDIATLNAEEKLFLVKTGPDRQGQEKEYGPFSLNMLIKLFQDSRINGKTLIYAPGLPSWIFLSDLPNYSDLFKEAPPLIDEAEKRQYRRKPFVARMFFHDSKKVFEGVCRDVSIGGMQVLVADFPGKPGDKISLNVHPENSEHHFVAAGKIVRLLEGESGFSFRFTDLNQDALSAINRYLGES